MPDPDDEGQPEVLPAAGRAGQADEPVPGGQQHQPGRRQRRDRRQRARGAPAPGRCQVLLRPGPQEDAGFARGRPGQGGLSQQAGHAGRAGGARARHRQGHWPATRRRCAGAERRHRGPAGQDRFADRHGGRIPRAARHHGRLLRAPRRPHRRHRLRHRRPLQAALRRRRAAAQHDRRGRGAGRQAGNPGGHVRHRQPADR